jgi:DNA repair protein RadA/Sms
VSAVASSFLDRPIRDQTVVLGEVGLTGEVRGVGQVESRVREAAKMGFTRCILPRSNLRRMPEASGVALSGVATIDEAMETLF